ncbi:MAG: hypothetical protein R8K47_06200 [Mariprofundaceae bacterium]
MSGGLDWSAPEQWLSLAGSVLILAAYAITVAHPARRRLYCAISLAGGALLLAVALIYRNAGLIVLEIAWIGINAWGLWEGYQEGGG